MGNVTTLTLNCKTRPRLRKNFFFSGLLSSLKTGKRARWIFSSVTLSFCLYSCIQSANRFNLAIMFPLHVLLLKCKSDLSRWSKLPDGTWNKVEHFMLWPLKGPMCIILNNRICIYQTWQPQETYFLTLHLWNKTCQETPLQGSIWNFIRLATLL